MRTNAKLAAGLTTFGLVAGLSQIPASASLGAPAEPAGHTSVAVAAERSGSAEIPPGYYDDAEGKSGEELRAALSTIISTDVQQLNYDEVWNL